MSRRRSDTNTNRASALSVTVWINVVYLAVGPTAIAYLCYFHGLRSVSPATATVAMFTVPLFGAAGGAVFLGERVTVVQLVGAAVMLGGALLAATARSTAMSRTPVPAAPPRSPLTPSSPGDRSRDRRGRVDRAMGLAPLRETGRS